MASPGWEFHWAFGWSQLRDLTTAMEKTQRNASFVAGCELRTWPDGTDIPNPMTGAPCG